MGTRMLFHDPDEVNDFAELARSRVDETAGR
jgi:hypothetical protein